MKGVGLEQEATRRTEKTEFSLILSSNGFWELCQVHYGFGVAAVFWVCTGTNWSSQINVESLGQLEKKVK